MREPNGPYRTAFHVEKVMLARFISIYPPTVRCHNFDTATPTVPTYRYGRRPGMVYLSMTMSHLYGSKVGGHVDVPGLSGGCLPCNLPGGYTVGEKVFFTGTGQTFLSGNKVVHGQQGEVTGPGTGQNYKGKAVAVLYPGNKGSSECFLDTVRRLRAASAATPRLRPTHATLPTRPVRFRHSLCRGAPALTA